MSTSSSSDTALRATRLILQRHHHDQAPSQRQLCPRPRRHEAISRHSMSCRRLLRQNLLHPCSLHHRLQSEHLRPQPRLLVAPRLPHATTIRRETQSDRRFLRLNPPPQLRLRSHKPQRMDHHRRDLQSLPPTTHLLDHHFKLHRPINLVRKRLLHLPTRTGTRHLSPQLH